MDKLFNLDNPVMQALGRIADVMIVNLLTLISFVPLVLVIVGIGSLGQAPGLLVMAALFVAALPVGPALTAMYYISLKMVRNEDSYIIRSYFKSYRDNFGQSVAIWAIFLVFFVFAFYDIYMLLHDKNSLFPTWMNYLILVVLFLLWCIFLWVFPVESRFVNTVGGTIRNAMIMTVAAFPRTLGMVGLSLIPLLLLYFAGDKLMPLLIMFGLAGPAYGQAKLFRRSAPPLIRNWRRNRKRIQNRQHDEKERSAFGIIPMKRAGRFFLQKIAHKGGRIFVEIGDGNHSGAILYFSQR